MSLPTSPSDAPVWVFGYGSLIYKVDFPFLQRRRARVQGWARRFWQGSHDHRGTPAAPGRVVTLVPSPGTECVGMAYRVAPDVFAHLDHREKNGYHRAALALRFDDDSIEDGIAYFAAPDNEAFLGPASDREIARHIDAAHGPSGSNRDYLLQLDHALRELDAHDDHVAAIRRALEALVAARA
jgi:cation transport protein ChaC